MTLLSATYFVVVFVVCSAWDEEISEWGAAQLQDEPAESVVSQYTPQHNDTNKPFKIHFVVWPNVSTEMRRAMETAAEWVNDRLSRALKAPTLPEIRRVRQWNASLERCDPAFCYDTEQTLPGVYVLPCRHPVTNEIVPESDVPAQATDNAKWLNEQNAITLIVYFVADDASPLAATTCGRMLATPAFARACQYDQVTKRPTHGYIGFCRDADALKKEKFSRVLLHEVLHIITAGNLAALASLGGGCAGNNSDDVFEHSSLCENVTYLKMHLPTLWLNGTMGNETRFLSKTPNVKKAVQEYFRCDTLEGAMLQTHFSEVKSREEPGDSLINRSFILKPGPHWDQLLFTDEVLLPFPFVGSAMRFSSITLGLLKDLGWYEVDMSVAETMQATRPQRDGCIVAKESCRDVVLHWRAMQKAQKEKNRVLPSMGPFCDIEVDVEDRAITSLCFNDTQPLYCRDSSALFGCGVVARPFFDDFLACDEMTAFPDQYLPEVSATVGPGTICLSVGPMHIQRLQERAAFGICVQYQCEANSKTVRLTMLPFRNGTCEIACTDDMSNKVMTVDFANSEHCKKHLGEKFPVICPTYTVVCATATAASTLPVPTSTMPGPAVVPPKYSTSKTIATTLSGNPIEVALLVVASTCVG